MNHRKHTFRKHIGASLIAFGVATFACTTQAQDMDVDQADTIDFQSFHKDKKEAVKVWDKKSTTTTKAYDDKPAEGSSAAPAQSSTTAAPAAAQTTTPVATAAKSTTTSTAALIPAGEAGKRFEIRERYTLTRSAKTPYSAFYVIEPLYKQAAQLCPRGWKKLTERSEPIEQDFYLYYELECL
jgi:hypothetical protein